MGTSAGTLLREARLKAGLSQSELARRAGVAQSVVSVYESGRRQPAVPTLSALIAATGHDLRMQIRRREASAALTGPVGRRVRRHRRQVLDVLHRHGAANPMLFGSVVRGEDRPDSDVDLLVDLPSGMGLLGLGRLRRELEEVLRARVDVVPASDLKPGVRKVVLDELVPL